MVWPIFIAIGAIMWLLSDDEKKEVDKTPEVVPPSEPSAAKTVPDEPIKPSE